MAVTHFGEIEEQQRPDDGKESQHKLAHGPLWCCARRPQICPVASICRAQKVVLKYNCDHDLSKCKEEGVDGPVANARLQSTLKERWALIPWPEKKFVNLAR